MSNRIAVLGHLELCDRRLTRSSQARCRPSRCCEDDPLQRQLIVICKKGELTFELESKLYNVEVGDSFHCVAIISVDAHSLVAVFDSKRRLATHRNVLHRERDPIVGVERLPVGLQDIRRRPGARNRHGIPRKTRQR